MQARRIWTTTDLTCAASQSVHMFSIWEIFHRILMPLNFLFIFRGIFCCSTSNLFRSIRFDSVVSAIVTCQMIPNFLKHPVHLKVEQWLWNIKRWFYSQCRCRTCVNLAADKVLN